MKQIQKLGTRICGNPEKELHTNPTYMEFHEAPPGEELSTTNIFSHRSGTVTAAIGKGDPNKPLGKMSSYTYFMQTCHKEHKKKHLDTSVNFSNFSKKCSEKWRTMSAKEKGKFENMAKGDKVHYDREMKSYIPPKGEKKKKEEEEEEEEEEEDPNAPKRPPSAFFLFCSEHHPKIKSDHPGLSIGDTAKKLGEM
ncbi:Hypothetical predicted protein [Podarcis lilfordi]|uniref:HMG box domain-containing protein n=1 Tax=Podarcis lilfordi TaxID=74358 RepID=A0AA35LBS9_9SAUR|nr:Hypothetical predicted protein [Podarcis lilfordi]